MNTKATVLVLVVAAAFGAAIWFQHQSLVQARGESEELRARLNEAADLASENERLSNLLAQAASSPAPAQQGELLRLRGEVGMLRRQTNELGRLLQEGNQRLQAAMQTRASAPAQPPSEPDSATSPLKQAGIAKMNDARILILGLINLSQANLGRLPASLDQLQPYFNAHPEDALTGTNQFELVYQGSLNDIGNPSSAIIVRETQPWQDASGGWLRAYGFADGHSEIHRSADGNFGPWEQQHLAAPRPAAQ